MIRMADQIAAFFEAYPRAEAVDGIGKHIKSFWDPRMRGYSTMTSPPRAARKLSPAARARRVLRRRSIPNPRPDGKAWLAKRRCEPLAGLPYEAVDFRAAIGPPPPRRREVQRTRICPRRRARNPTRRPACRRAIADRGACCPRWQEDGHGNCTHAAVIPTIAIDAVPLHKRTHCSQDTAHASHVSGERVAKAVVLTREGGFVVAVVPSLHAQVRLEQLQRHRHCPGQHGERGRESRELFPDCARRCPCTRGLCRRSANRRQPRQATRCVFGRRRPPQPVPHLWRAVPLADAGRAARTHRRPQRACAAASVHLRQIVAVLSRCATMRLEHIDRGVLAEDAVDVPGPGMTWRS